MPKTTRSTIYGGLPAEVRDSAAYVTHEHAFHEFRQVGEIEGITFDDEAGEMIVLANRGKRIVLGMPKGLYPGYDREIHELYVYKVRLSPVGFLAACGAKATSSE